jgi:hypothetical protein
LNRATPTLRAPAVVSMLDLSVIVIPLAQYMQCILYSDPHGCQKGREEYVQSISWKRAAEPEDIVDLLLFWLPMRGDAALGIYGW